MPPIDLHSHSHYSDGSLSPADLFRLAGERGLEALALTDHDSIRGLPEAAVAAAAAGVRLINGVEISAMAGPLLVHVVGLNIDPANAGLNERLAEQAGARGRRARLIADKLAAMGLGDCWETVLDAAARDADRVGRTHFARWLVDAGHVRSIQQAFSRYLANGKPAAVPIPWADMAEAVRWIREAGGVAVLAHPTRYGISHTKLRGLLQAFADAGGQAIEVSCGTDKPNVAQQMATLATRFGLHASQGSDYHGAHMPWIRLGCFPALPAGCRPVWELF